MNVSNKGGVLILAFEISKTGKNFLQIESCIVDKWDRKNL